jgi:hypothetical protein
MLIQSELCLQLANAYGTIHYSGRVHIKAQTKPMKYEIP